MVKLLVQLGQFVEQRQCAGREIIDCLSSRVGVRDHFFLGRCDAQGLEYNE